MVRIRCNLHYLENILTCFYDYVSAIKKCLFEWCVLLSKHSNRYPAGSAKKNDGWGCKKTVLELNIYFPLSFDSRLILVPWCIILKLKRSPGVVKYGVRRLIVVIFVHRVSFFFSFDLRLIVASCSTNTVLIDSSFQPTVIGIIKFSSVKKVSA